MMLLYMTAVLSFLLGFLCCSLLVSGRDRGWTRRDGEVTGFQIIEALRRAKE